MGWNGEDHANAIIAAQPLAMPLGVAGPFDRALWFDRLAALHWTGIRRSDAHGEAGGATAWLPLVEPAAGQRESLANWYSFAHRPLFSGSNDPAVQQLALTDLFARLRGATARLTLYPVPETDGSVMLVRQALKAAGWWVRAQPEGDSHWLAQHRCPQIQETRRGDRDFGRLRPGAMVPL
jgi:hypothetical protein